LASVQVIPVSSLTNLEAISRFQFCLQLRIDLDLLSLASASIWKRSRQAFIVIRNHVAVARDIVQEHTAVLARGCGANEKPLATLPSRMMQHIHSLKMKKCKLCKFYLQP
jgi:hypothetical protein